jgi:hypothetical protein
MVLDPTQIGEAALRALAGGSTDTPQESTRSQQAKLSFSAMLAALQSGCDCEACQLLREACEVMRVRPRSQEAPRGPGVNPQT